MKQEWRENCYLALAFWNDGEAGTLAGKQINGDIEFTIDVYQNKDIVKELTIGVEHMFDGYERVLSIFKDHTVESDLASMFQNVESLARHKFLQHTIWLEIIITAFSLDKKRRTISERYLSVTGDELVMHNAFSEARAIAVVFDEMISWAECKWSLGGAKISLSDNNIRPSQWK